jgi:hypothetical protein
MLLTCAYLFVTGPLVVSELVCLWSDGISKCGDSATTKLWLTDDTWHHVSLDQGIDGELTTTDTLKTVDAPHKVLLDEQTLAVLRPFIVDDLLTPTQDPYPYELPGRLIQRVRERGSVWR